jgi:hypothetical protein
MELIFGIIIIVGFIFIFFALINTADNTKKTNILLRLMLNEQNPERFVIKSISGKILDKETGKKI